MSETPLGYYKWYPRDFYTSIVVRSMSFTARAIYRELLDIQWESKCLPNAKRLLGALGITEEQWAEFAPYMGELFPNGENPRLAQLREDAIERSQKRAESGSKGGKSKQVPSKSEANAKQVLSQTETETETETITSYEVIRRAPGIDFQDKAVPASFEEFKSYGSLLLLPEYEIRNCWTYWNIERSWMDGTNPVKDWKGRVRTWVKGYQAKGGKLETPKKLGAQSEGVFNHWDEVPA